MPTPLTVPNESSPLMHHSSSMTSSLESDKSEKAKLLANAVLRQNLNRLICVVVVVFLLAAAGQRASFRDFLIDHDDIIGNITNSNSNGSNAYASDPLSNSTSNSNDEDDFEMITSCQVLYQSKSSSSSSSSSRGVRVIQTAKATPGEHYVPLNCNIVKKLSSNDNIAPGEIAPIKVDFANVLNADRENGIIGFGGAFTEASALNFQSLDVDGQEAVLDLLFGESGLGYNMGRVHINSCDFCTSSYSFDDVDGDFNLDDFDNGVTHDVNTGMIDMMQRAQAKLRESWTSNNEHPLHLVASPWSPPSWMKLPINNEHTDYQHAGMVDHAKSMTGSAWPTCLREGTGPGSRYAQTWALYFSKFINAYKDNDISIWAVTVQNEPEFPAPWEACVFTPDVEGDFIAFHLGPKLEKDHPDVNLLIFDHNKDHGPMWMSNLLDPNNPASKFIKGTGLHWYAGGMDRLLDGALGTPNMHKMVASNDSPDRKDQLILGTEACHCPSTYYAGGDLSIGWARAQRYAHTILADLAAGSNGWIEWNLILDSVGGPNHLGNVCDAPLLAVPHRASGAINIPSQLSFEKVGHPFGDVNGDFIPPFILEADYGFPQKYLDVGVAVQPMYFYMGHISRHVRPGARPVHALVKGFRSNKNRQIFRRNGQAGGGINDLARVGIELTLWPCEGSTRQIWTLNDLGQLQVFGEDWVGNPTTSCASTNIDQYFGGLTLADCDANGGLFRIHSVGNSTDGYMQVKLQNSLADPAHSCLIVQELANNGGALGPLGGAQVITGNCNEASASLWRYSKETGELISDYFSEMSTEVCMTTGWPFLQVGAFKPADSSGDHSIVILNEAGLSANIQLDITTVDGQELSIQSSIPAYAIQTILV